MRRKRQRPAALNLSRVLLQQKTPMSKAQLKAFLAKVEANQALKLQMEAAADASAVVAIARAEGFSFSPASLERHLRG